MVHMFKHASYLGQMSFSPKVIVERHGRTDTPNRQLYRESGTTKALKIQRESGTFRGEIKDGLLVVHES